MAHLEFHQADGGYRVHDDDDGTVEPGVYVSNHQAAARVRALNLTGPAAGAPRPAAEILRYVEGMVELASSFPAGLAERYGSPPTQDIPFATAAPRPRA